MKAFSRNSVIFSVVFVTTLLIDRLTKFWIVDRFHYGERLTVIPDFFNLTHVRNPGGAWSFLATMSPEFRQIFFLGSGLLAIILLLAFFRRLEPGQTLSAAAIGAVLGGAIGNLTDRLIYGEVIDFLDFRLWGGYVWPTFNMADSWIVMGVGVLMLEMFLEPDVDEPDSSTQSDAEGTEGLERALTSDLQGPSAS